MAIDRIKQLQKFYEEDPTDPFNLYALAMEFLNKEPDKALSLFERLLREHKEYLPTYYPTAKLYQALGENERAIAVYEEGMLLARKLNNVKTLRELQSAHDELMFE